MSPNGHSNNQLFGTETDFIEKQILYIKKDIKNKDNKKVNFLTVKKKSTGKGGAVEFKDKNNQPLIFNAQLFLQFFVP